MENNSYTIRVIFPNLVFPSSQKKLYKLQSYPCFSPSIPCHLLTFLFLWICLFWTLQKVVWLVVAFSFCLLSLYKMVLRSLYVVNSSLLIKISLYMHTHPTHFYMSFRSFIYLFISYFVSKRFLMWGKGPLLCLYHNWNIIVILLV